MRIGIAGLMGRMGRLVAEEAVAAGCTVTGGTARQTGGGPPGVPLFSSIEGLALSSEAVIDFTQADAAVAHAAGLRKSGSAWVLGTTGLSDAAEDAIRAAARDIPVVWAANFSPGMALVLAVAEQLARALPGAEYDAEIVEMHHRGKRDAPSGTALALARAVAAGRGTALEIIAARDGQIGARPPGAVGVAALRGGQVVGAHTLLFAGDAEHISLSHTAVDRRVFARGAVMAALWVRGRGAGLYGMRDVLGIRGSKEGLLF